MPAPAAISMRAIGYGLQNTKSRCRTRRKIGRSSSQPMAALWRRQVRALESPNRRQRTLFRPSISDETILGQNDTIFRLRRRFPETGVFYERPRNELGGCHVVGIHHRLSFGVPHR
jgi:hypothetical protein